MRFPSGRTFPLLALAMISAGCRPSITPPTTGGPAAVPVSSPVQRQITEYVEYTGRADAVDTIGVKARATGFLIRAPFTEGAEVKKGDLLFEIDPRPYEAQLAQAEAQVRWPRPRRSWPGPTSPGCRASAGQRPSARKM